MSPCSGHNEREKKEIPTQISNVTEPIMCDKKDKATADLELQ